MDFNVEPISKVKQRLVIRVSGNEISGIENKILNDVRKDIKVPGFRQGKVPAHIIRQRLGKDLRQDAISRAARKFVEEATDKIDNLLHVGTIDVPEMKTEDNGIVVSAEIEIDVPVELNNYKDIEVEKLSDAVKDEDVEKSLQERRESLATFVPIEDRDDAREGDSVYVTLASDDEGAKQIGLVGKRDTILGSGDLINKKFEKEIIGAKVGETRMIVADLSATDDENAEKDENNEGHTILVSCTVDELKSRVLPELDDDFAKDTGDAETLDELRSKTRQKLEENKKKEVEDDLNEKILAVLRERHEIEIPKGYVRVRAASAMRIQLERMFRQQINDDMMMRIMNSIGENELKSYSDNYCDEKILTAIAKAENLSCTDDEILAEAKKWFSENTAEDKIVDWLKDDEAKKLVSDALLRDKALELVKAAAKISVKED